MHHTPKLNITDQRDRRIQQRKEYRLRHWKCRRCRRESANELTHCKCCGLLRGAPFDRKDTAFLKVDLEKQKIQRRVDSINRRLGGKGRPSKAQLAAVLAESKIRPLLIPRGETDYAVPIDEDGKLSNVRHVRGNFDSSKAVEIIALALGGALFR